MIKSEIYIGGKGGRRDSDFSVWCWVNKALRMHGGLFEPKHISSQSQSSGGVSCRFALRHSS